MYAQREHLLVLRDYLEWLSKSNDEEVASSSQNLVDLLDETTDGYDVLMNTLQRQINQNDSSS